MIVKKTKSITVTRVSAKFKTTFKKYLGRLDICYANLGNMIVCVQNKKANIPFVAIPSKTQFFLIRQYSCNGC